ncbi:MAG: DUF4123 domain-containing protein [Pseudomonas sp.]
MAPVSLQAKQQALISPIDRPSISMFSQHQQPWLWLDGASNPNLETEVATLTAGLNYRWLWRGTRWEYSAPGYRQGPLLVPLSDTTLQMYLSKWAVDSTGVILTTFQDKEALFVHLQKMLTVKTSDNNPVMFNFGMTRQVEEFATGLPLPRFAQLMGPIHSIIFPCQDSFATEWLQVQCPAQMTAAPAAEAFRLTAEEERSVNLANQAWFMKHAAKRITRQMPKVTQQQNPEELSRRLEIFKKEADEAFLYRERDVYHYLLLRSTYPGKFFADGSPLRALLSQRTVDPRLRLTECERRLQQFVTEAN